MILATIAVWKARLRYIFNNALQSYEETKQGLF